MKEGKRVSVIEIIILLLSAVLMIGVKAAFHACPVMEDNIMSCRWAEQAVFGTGIVLTAQSLILLIVKHRAVKAGVCIAMIPSALLGALIPGILINLCMRADMRCVTLMKPCVIIICVVLAVLAAVNTALIAKRMKVSDAKKGE